MSNNSKLTPRLRFPEFRKRPGWEKTALGVVVSPIVREREKPAAPYTGLGIRSHGKGTFLKPLEQPEKKSMERLYEVECDDLIVNITFAWEGAVAIARPSDAGTLVSHRFPTYLIDRNVALPEFLQYPILGKQFIYQLGVISPGGAGRNRVLSKSDFLKLVLPIPSIPEQRNIAACLGSLDELISGEGRKLELLRAYKKGLVQQLFPRDGETTPRLRFPEFRGNGEWNSVPLGKLLVRSPEYGVNAAACAFSPQLPTYIRITDIDDDGNFIGTNRACVDIEAEPDNYLADGDIVLARTGASVGKSYRYRPEDGKLIFAGFLIRVRPDSTKLVSAFLGAFLSTEPYKEWVRVTSTRSGQPGINGTEYAGLPIPTPPVAEGAKPHAEQQLVADCLLSLDARITAQSEKLAALRTHKKALMQQLFPSTAETDA